MAVSYQEPDLELGQCSQHTRNYSKTPFSCSLTLSSPFSALWSPYWNLSYTSLFEIVLCARKVTSFVLGIHTSFQDFGYVTVFTLLF